MVAFKSKLIYQFKVTLMEISPRIWRRIQVPEHYTFWDLHVAIQDSMGWLGYHLHAFDFQKSDGKHSVKIGIPDNERDDYRTLPGWEVMIADHFIRPGIAMPYKYDFGDGWVHSILLEGILVGEPKWKYPRCLAGERACPPEDCDGTEGYVRLLEILRSPNHPKYAEYVDWLKGHAKNYHPYDPECFDPQAVRFGNPKKRLSKVYAESELLTEQVTPPYGDRGARGKP